MPEFFWRTLWLHVRPARKAEDDRWGMRGAAVITLALTLVRYDREVALALLATAEAPRQGTPYHSENLYRAVALADPARAAAMLAELLPARETDWTRDAIVTVLLAEGPEVSRAVHRALAQWYVDEEDL